MSRVSGAWGRRPLYCLVILGAERGPPQCWVHTGESLDQDGVPPHSLLGKELDFISSECLQSAHSASYAILRQSFSKCPRSISNTWDLFKKKKRKTQRARLQFSDGECCMMLTKLQVLFPQQARKHVQMDVHACTHIHARTHTRANFGTWSYTPVISALK